MILRIVIANEPQRRRSVAINSAELRRHAGIADGFVKWIATRLLTQPLAMTNKPSVRQHLAMTMGWRF